MRPPDASTPAPVPVGIGWRHGHHRALLEQCPALDFIEVHSENHFAPGGAARALLRAARKHYPVSLHGVGLSLGSAIGIDPWHLDRLAALVQDIDPWMVSDHACFARGRVTGRAAAVHAADLLPVPMTRTALDVMCTHVSCVQDRLRRPIAVENLSAYLHWPDHDMDEPFFLNALAQRTGCGLLVDVNNLMVNALNAQRRGETTDPLQHATAWLDGIEARAVKELHLAGHADTGDLVIDDHGSRVSPPVWTLYRHALRRFGPLPTLIEWDTDLPALSVLLDEAALAGAHARQALAGGAREAVA